MLIRWIVLHSSWLICSTWVIILSNFCCAIPWKFDVDCPRKRITVALWKQRTICGQFVLRWTFLLQPRYSRLHVGLCSKKQIMPLGGAMCTSFQSPYRQVCYRVSLSQPSKKYPHFIVSLRPPCRTGSAINIPSSAQFPAFTTHVNGTHIIKPLSLMQRVFTL